MPGINAIPRDTLLARAQAFQPSREPYLREEVTFAHDTFLKALSDTKGATVGELLSQATAQQDQARRDMVKNNVISALCVVGMAGCMALAGRAIGYFVDPTPFATLPHAFEGASEAGFLSAAGMLICGKFLGESQSGADAASDRFCKAEILKEGLTRWGTLIETPQNSAG